VLLDEMTRLALALMRGIAQCLGLEPNYFFDRYTRDPLIRVPHLSDYPGVSGAVLLLLSSCPIVRSLGRR
jgi:isopenicillin N synthase-like dioxygenase